MLNSEENFNAGIVGLGVYLPEKRVTEKDFLNAGVPKELIDKWGVYEHRVSEPDETPSDMSIKAAKNLIENTNINPREIDLIIDCALVPDHIFPGNSHQVQYQIGAVNAAAIDIGPSSAGVISQIMLAKSLICSKSYHNVLITCSCKFTSVADNYDLASLVIAGDGAAAALVSNVNINKGILSSNIITKGEFYPYSGIKMKVSSNSKDRGMIYDIYDKKLLFYINNNDKNLISKDNEKSRLDKFICDSIPLSAKLALRDINLSYDNVDFWITHQNANALHEYWIDILGIRDKKNYYYSNYKYGNIYNANLLVNLKEAIDENYIKDNDIIVLGGLSSGFSTGSVVMRWGK